MIRRLRRRIKLGFCRSRLSDIEDTMASLQGESLLCPMCCADVARAEVLPKLCVG